MWTNRTLELNGIRYIIDQNGYVTMNKPGQFIQDKDGDWAYIKENGQLATGLQIINHQNTTLIQLENKPKENDFCLMESTISSMKILVLCS